MVKVFVRGDTTLMSDYFIKGGVRMFGKKTKYIVGIIVLLGIMGLATFVTYNPSNAERIQGSWGGETEDLVITKDHITVWVDNESKTVEYELYGNILVYIDVYTGENRIEYDLNKDTLVLHFGSETRVYDRKKVEDNK